MSEKWPKNIKHPVRKYGSVRAAEQLTSAYLFTQSADSHKMADNQVSSAMRAYQLPVIFVVNNFKIGKLQMGRNINRITFENRKNLVNLCPKTV